MNPDPFEYEPLGNLFRALDSEPDELTNDELKDDLLTRGLNPEATSAAVTSQVNVFLKGRRLSWQDEAKQKQADLKAIAAQAVSWGARKKEEIEAAFNDVREGTYGVGVQGQLQSAFRNLASISTEDKASFLDDVDLIQKIREADRTKSEDGE